MKYKNHHIDTYNKLLLLEYHWKYFILTYLTDGSLLSVVVGLLDGSLLGVIDGPTGRIEGLPVGDIPDGLFIKNDIKIYNE